MTERLGSLPAAELRVARWAADLAPRLPTHGRVLFPGLPEPGWQGRADGNRAVVLDDVGVHHAGQRWSLSIKGVGARFPMFGDLPPNEPRAWSKVAAGRWLGRDAWFGEAPWGAQGDEGVEAGLRRSDEADGVALFGLPICPVMAAVRLPDELVQSALPARYRAWTGGFWQEHRLVPGRVRLFSQSEHTLAEDPEGMVRALGVADVPGLDAFIERLLSTGLAALTLLARSATRRDDGRPGLRGLGYAHVWLDKDTILAPDGRLCFADLEGIVEVRLVDEAHLVEQVRRQLEDHLYELLYAVDRLLEVSERWRSGPPPSRARDLALRVELALDGDPWLQPLPRRGGLDLRVRCPALAGPSGGASGGASGEALTLRLLDA